MVIRWLHISDVHECSRDGYHRTAMHTAILAAVKARANQLDFIFFTGDLAYAGTKEEYDSLEANFLTPLKAILPSTVPVFTVPGNHDVNRKRGVNPRLWMENEAERNIFQSVGKEGQQKRVDAILPRFEAYQKIETALGAWGQDWLASETGAVCVSRDVSGRKVAIVGINTAWLCHDNDDWGKLTAGKTMVDAALRQAEGADLVIVLGHHPLEAMQGEQKWSDGQRIRTRLQQAAAIYLHGHLHKSGGQIASDSLQSVLAIQAPSGFQAADSDRWRNGIMWAEADLDSGHLIIEPLRWNEEQNLFIFDNEAVRDELRVPGRDAFTFPLPGRQPVVAGDISGAQTAAEGWQIFDTARLAALSANRPSTAMMADWFNGTFPSWEVATATGVQPRKVVDDLIRGFQQAFTAAPRPVVRLLTGAGGEGKSAVLLQTAAGLLRMTDQSWTCLWRQSSAAGLPDNLSATLPKREGHCWMIAVDDAESIGKPLAAALAKLGARTDVHVILAARDADWSLRGNTDVQWQGVADFKRFPLAGIDEVDARRITDTWAAWGDGAMGLLRGKTAEEAAKALFDSAKKSEAKNEKGALLGALIKTREGEDYRERVARLMAPMRDATGIGTYSLLDIYAMIAAMHAENQLYLSQAVLAYALGCNESDLARSPLRMLRAEAMVDGGTAYILTRHRLIAEVARDWLVENDYDIERLYPLLAVAARKRSIDTRQNFDVAKFTFDLPNYFVELGGQKAQVGVSIAKALHLADPTNFGPLTNYSKILRRTGKPQDALVILAANVEVFCNHRNVLSEWAVAAGEAKDQGLSVWLAARAIADERTTMLEETTGQLALIGMARAFEYLSKSHSNSSYHNAQAACGRLGLKFPNLDQKTSSYLKQHAQAAPSAANPPSIAQDIEIIRQAAITASYEAEPENTNGLEAHIGEPDSYRYTMLADLLSGKRPTRR